MVKSFTLRRKSRTCLKNNICVFPINPFQRAVFLGIPLGREHRGCGARKGPGQRRGDGVDVKG